MMLSGFQRICSSRNKRLVLFLISVFLSGVASNAAASAAPIVAAARIQELLRGVKDAIYPLLRVTCRDWFQLGLKEGLTVFRDQEISSDLGSRTVNLKILGNWE